MTRKDQRPDGVTHRGDDTSGAARIPPLATSTVAEPDGYVKMLHAELRRDAKLTVVLDLQAIEGLIEARRCVDQHCASAERDDVHHAKALRELDRLLGAPDRSAAPLTTNERSFLNTTADLNKAEVMLGVRRLPVRVDMAPTAADVDAKAARKRWGAVRDGEAKPPTDDELAGRSPAYRAAYRQAMADDPLPVGRSAER